MPYSGGQSGGGGDNIHHYGVVRLRVTGSGNLQLAFTGLDDVVTANLTPIAMAATPGREPRVLANFVGQRARFKIQTTVKDETFRINRIIIFAKPIWSEYPG